MDTTQTDSKARTVSVVLLTYRRPEMLRRHIEELLKLEGLLEAIVVDNDPQSEDDLSDLDDSRLRYM